MMGSVIVPKLLALMPGGLLFGWAKPVPIDPRNFRSYRKGDILVSLAGVAVDLLLVVAFTALMVGAVWLSRMAPVTGSLGDVLWAV